MFTPLTLFIISLVAIIFLIVHKVMELHKGTPLVFEEMRDKGDSIITKNVMQNGQAFLAKGWLAFRAAFLMIKGGVYRATVRALHGVQHVIAKTLERVKRAGAHKHVTKKDGSVSFFLKHVSDEAKQIVAEEQK